MNLRVLIKVGKFLNSCIIGGFSRRAQLHEVSYDTIIGDSDENQGVNITSQRDSPTVAREEI
jgi:hypothetical protein